MARKRVPTGDHEVGYCRPPSATRFRKGGPSPNPKGRPRKPKPASTEEAVAEMIWEHMGQPVTVRLPDGSTKQVEAFEAMLLQLQAKAMGGSTKHLELVMRLLKEFDLLVPGRQAQARGGVLVVPESPASPEEWERQYGAGSPYWTEHQARLAEGEAKWLKPQPPAPAAKPVEQKAAPTKAVPPPKSVPLSWGSGMKH